MKMRLTLVYWNRIRNSHSIHSKQIFRDKNTTIFLIYVASYVRHKGIVFANSYITTIKSQTKYVNQKNGLLDIFTQNNSRAQMVVQGFDIFELSIAPRSNL